LRFHETVVKYRRSFWPLINDHEVHFAGELTFSEVSLKINAAITDDTCVAATITGRYA
jgi:hypothetical protein